jgi:H+/gluconate symporter-like permease
MFEAPSMFGLLPLVLFIVLIFRKWNPIASLGAAVVLGAIMAGKTPIDVAVSIKSGLGGFMAYVGVIIMAGAGLGKVAEKTGVAKRIIKFVINRIGIDTENKAIIGLMVVCTLMPAMLGTLAGSNALIAPVAIPIVAAAGLSSSVVAVIFQGAGATGLFLGPFTPPMVTLMELTGLSYLQVVIYAGLPVSLLLWVTTFWYTKKILKKSLIEHPYTGVDLIHDDGDESEEELRVSTQATTAFLITLVGLLAYGIYIKGGSTFAIFVIITTTLVTGIVGRLHPNEIADTFTEGAKPLVWLYFQFVLFTPFISFVTEMGGFQALANVILPYIESGGQKALVILSTIIGIAGIPGGAVAQKKIIHEMFLPMVTSMKVPMNIWVLVLLMGSQITSFLYPTGDTLGAMGIARSDDVKNMIIFGVFATIPPILFIVLRALFM